MFEFLKHVLNGQNQFASGGLLLMILGSIGVFLRALPERLWWWFVDQTTMTVSVTDDDEAFGWVKEWFLEQKFLTRVRRVDLDTTLRGAELALIPAPSVHWFWRDGRPCWVWFYRSNDTQGRSQRRIESLTFRTIGRDRRFLKLFVDEVIDCHHRKRGSASFLYLYDEGWGYFEAYSPRLLESVVLKPGEKEHLIQDLERFRASRDRYRRLGVPYHRGYLLYGPPWYRQDFSRIRIGSEIRPVHLHREPGRPERPHSEDRDEFCARKLGDSLRGYRRHEGRQPQVGID